MATTLSYINYVCEQLEGVGEIRYRKMFGEYMVYVDDKPVVIVCDNTAYVKKLDVISEMMKDASFGYPYEGAKEHYILNIDDALFSQRVIKEVASVTKLPRKKKAN